MKKAHLAIELKLIRCRIKKNHISTNYTNYLLPQNPVQQVLLDFSAYQLHQEGHEYNCRIQSILLFQLEPSDMGSDHIFLLSHQVNTGTVQLHYYSQVLMSILYYNHKLKEIK